MEQIAKASYEAYVDYLALKRHFESEGYDYFKYNGKVSASVDSLQKRRDKLMFYRLGRQPDYHGLIVANIVAKKGKKMWVGDLLSDNAKDIYTEWLKTKNSLTYHVRVQLSELHEEDFDDLLRVTSGQHPKLLTQYMRGAVSLETLIALNSVAKFMPYWNRKINPNILWKPVYIMSKKYRPFLDYEVSKIKELIIDRFE